MTLIITHCEKPRGGGPFFNENVISGAFGAAKIAVFRQSTPQGGESIYILFDKQSVAVAVARLEFKRLEDR